MPQQSPRTAIKLEQHLTLLAWLHQWLGYQDTRELLADISQAQEGFDSDGRSHVLARLSARSNLDDIKRRKMVAYDENIRTALAYINKGRAEPITLRYFQHLAALYAEIYLDYRWNYPDVFLACLNEFVRKHDRGTSCEFVTTDLDKLAFWMATGSGKTLLLHLNFRQFLHYNHKTLDNIILITPNERLSEQHLAEMAKSNISCCRFDLLGPQLIYEQTIQVTEITKLVMEKRGRGESVPIEAFEGNNLIFVDEGHKGFGWGCMAPCTQCHWSDWFHI